MKRIATLIFFAGLFFPVLGQNPPLDKNWEVIFQDDFSTLNTQRWKVQYGPANSGAGNDEGVPFRTYENTFIENGKLVLRVLKEDHECISWGTCLYPKRIHPYTSGGIESRAKYPYGYYEMYAKLPSSLGFSPGWMFHSSGSISKDSCWYHEINLIEAHVCSSNDYGANLHANYYICTEPNPHFMANSDDIKCIYGDGYHWFGVEWDRDRVIWYFDRKIVRQVPNSVEGNAGVQNPMTIHLGIALRDTPPCSIPANTPFPQDMIIDTINAYRLKCDKNTVVNETLFSYLSMDGVFCD